MAVKIERMKDQRIPVMMSSDDVESIDNWRRKNPNLHSRSEAIRRLVELGLRARTDAAEYQAKANEGATKARKLAGELGLKKER